MVGSVLPLPSRVEGDTESDVWAEIDDDANAEAAAASVSCGMTDIMGST